MGVAISSRDGVFSGLVSMNPCLCLEIPFEVLQGIVAHF